MLTDVSLTLDKDGRVQNAQSTYAPSEAAKFRLSQVREWMQTASAVRNRPYREFNDVSLVDRMNLDQMSFGQYVEPPSMDPAEAWRSRAFRPVVRNQVIKIAAHVTASVIEPLVFAQNDADEEDRDSAAVMRDVMEWVNERSDYDRTFICSVVGALVNPCHFAYTENTKRYRTKRWKKPDGSIDSKKILDEWFSGLKDYSVPCDEVWITNPYEPDIQKQPVVVWRRVIDYSDARARHAGNADFDAHVRPGVQVFMGDDALFYEAYDRDLNAQQVEDLIVWVPTEGLRLEVMNGVLLTDPDEPNPREDGLVPLVKFIYELIDEGRFFYGKSLVFKLGPDEAVINTAYRMTEDGTYLVAMPPAVAFGVDTVQSAVMIPGAVTTFDNSTNPQASFETIAGNNNVAALYRLTELAEKSINESGASPLIGGDAPSGDSTAYEISRVEQNARTVLGLFGKMIGFAVRDWGRLKIGDIVQHVMVGEVTEIVGNPLKFRKLLLPNKTSNGRKVTKQIEFVSPDQMPQDGSEESVMKASREIRRAELAKGDRVQIIRVNPELGRKLKYSVVCRSTAVMPESPAMRKALMLEEYALGKDDPMLNQEEWKRDLLLGAFERTAEDPDRYMKRPEEIMQMVQQEQGAGGQAGLSSGFKSAAKAEGGIRTPAGGTASPLA